MGGGVGGWGRPPRGGGRRDRAAGGGATGPDSGEGTPASEGQEGREPLEQHGHRRQRYKPQA